MARTVRKVSRATTKDQKKESKINKKVFISLLTFLILICVGLGVGLGIYFATKKENEYVSKKIYFNEPVMIDDVNSVTFNKENYQTILRYIDSGNYAEEIFIFVYDGTAFYGDEQDKKKYDKKYTELITRLAHLQYTINQMKKSGKNIELYVVDVAVDNSINVDILVDSVFGALYTNEEAQYEPAFIYIQNGKYKQKVEYKDESGVNQNHTISTKEWTEVLNSSIVYAMNYIKTL